MTVKELKKILEEYEDNANVQIAIHGFDEVYNYNDVKIDFFYNIDDAVVFYVSDECLGKECEEEMEGGI